MDNPIVATFWHIVWFAGVAVLASRLAAMGLHSAGYTRLALEAGTSSEDAEHTVE